MSLGKTAGGLLLLSTVLIAGIFTGCQATEKGPDADLIDKANAGDAAAQLALGEKQVAANPAIAATWFQKAADRGNAEAQGMLGMMYLQGKGVAKDETQGNSWIEKSASGGFALAQRMMCSRALAQNDDAKTIEWCEKAAAQNDPVAQSILGQVFLMGKGAKRDLPQAASWFHKSAEQGNGNAQLSLSKMCALGMGTKQDLIESYFWLRLASLAQNELETPEQMQSELAAQGKRLRPEQKEAVEKRVQDWVKTHPTSTLANN